MMLFLSKHVYYRKNETSRLILSWNQIRMSTEPYHCTCMEGKLLQSFQMKFVEKREFLVGFQL